MNKPKMSDIQRMGKFEFLYDNQRIMRLLVARVEDDNLTSIIELLLTGRASIVYIQKLGRN